MGFRTAAWAFCVKKNRGPIRPSHGRGRRQIWTLPRPCPLAHRWAPTVVPTREICPSASPRGFRVPAPGVVIIPHPRFASHPIKRSSIQTFAKNNKAQRQPRFDPRSRVPFYHHLVFQLGLPCSIWPDRAAIFSGTDLITGSYGYFSLSIFFLVSLSVPP